LFSNEKLPVLPPCPDFTYTSDSLHVVVDLEQMRMRRCDNLGAFGST